MAAARAIRIQERVAELNFFLMAKHQHIKERDVKGPPFIINQNSKVTTRAKIHLERNLNSCKLEK